MSFKLIAIRPIVGISPKFLKNLVAGEVYNLCNDYTLNNSRGRPSAYEDYVYAIVYKQTVPEYLYSIPKINGEITNVNISAVVGKNGAGKSSLMDLLLYSLFVVSNNLGLVDTDNFIEPESSNKDRNELSRYQQDIKQIEKGLKVEIYYLLNERYYRITINSGKSQLESVSCLEKGSSFEKDNLSLKDYSEINNFFYTIVVNYSFYAYNTNYNGIWLKSFFHKNDGYQMPVVINPFRNEGKIDINSETLLTRSRLLSNILSIPRYKKINYKSSIDRIELYFNKEKDYKFLSIGEVRFTSGFIEKFRTLILKPLFSLMFKDTFQYPSIDNPLKEVAEIYLINKLITIPSRYHAFRTFDKRLAKVKERPDNYEITQNAAKSFVNEIYNDRSHITLKVRQTLNFLREDLYDLPFGLDLQGKFELGSVVREMNKLKRYEWFTELIDYLPPPFFVSKIRFTDGSYFDDLSSGEKQKIYCLNSVIYHLRNLESINKNKTRNFEKHVSSFQSVNLIFDEVELYYHPQYQKETVSSLLNLIRISDFRFIKNINIVFLTHSPFILSDIPIQNTALLTIDKRTGRSKLVKKKKQSFGANIHDLLADNFFLTGTLIGDLADKRILQLIKKIKTNELTNEDKLMLKLIGDTFLKTSIEQYKDKYD
jgi:energy-coupling factor transporter ATP-binding protein EcfA2